MPKLAISLDITASPLAILYGTTAIYIVDGKLPNLITDFSRDFYYNDSFDTFSNTVTHSAPSNATMVDSDGLLKWRPHNLLTYSEQFDNAVWVKTNATVTANATVAPDGTTTADQLFDDVTLGAHYIGNFNVIASTNFSRTTSVWVKGNTARYVVVTSRAPNGVNTQWNNIFDTQDGVWVYTGSSGVSNFAAVDAGNGWWKIAFVDATDSGAYDNVYIGVSSGPDLADIEYSGSGQSIYIWGAHLYRSDLGGMVNNPDRGDSYVPTTTSAVYLPRRGHHVYNGDSWVNKGLLHESEARTNLAADSNDFSAASWLLGNTSITANDAVSPDGNANASYLNIGFNGYVQTNFSHTIGQQYTVSAWVKSYDGTDELFRLFGEGTASSADLTATNEWQRFSFTYTATKTTGGDGITRPSSNAAAHLHVYGFQIEAGSTPSSYIPTSGATVTRSAETLTVPAANLPWPSPVVIGEELVTNGTFDTDTDWVKTNYVISGGAASTISSATNPSLSQSLAGLTEGAIYEVRYTASVDSGSAGLFPNLGTIGNPTALSRTISNTTPTEYSFVTVAGPTGVLKFTNTTTASVLTLDNISVKEINPLSVSIQMQGEMTYADTDDAFEVRPIYWFEDGSNNIEYRLSTSGGEGGLMFFFQEAAGVVDSVSLSGAYSPGVNVPFNIASRHGSTFINGAVDGTALTVNTTPVALPDLSATDLQLGYDFMGTISLFRVWADDLTDAGIAEASAPSTVPSLSLTFDGASTSFTDTGLVV